MARKIANNSLNATTLDILNVIRQNASFEYQQLVPEVTQATDIPKVGEVIVGTPSVANQFLNALVNRIALVRAQSAVFNNPYSNLKKGYLEFGETVEDIFVNIAKVVEYTPEKGEEREFKRTLPDVRSAFHIMNWRVMYPVTIQNNDLKMAFLSVDGVTELIAKIVDSVYTAAEYDEFLLFKYLIVKAVAHNQIKVINVDTTDFNNTAIAFRGMSNKLPFMSTQYNISGVKTTTPKSEQVIFMDSDFNAQYDVSVLASAFNMDKADFMGRLYLIDDWTTFDNERFEVIRENSDGLEEVTSDELSVMQYVKAIIFDEKWFQVYDNHNQFTEKFVASGLYWNYFYHVWKTVSTSPFSNAVCFTSAEVTTPATLTVTIDGKIASGESQIVNVYSADYAPNFVQTEDLTELGVAVHKYGSFIIPLSILTDVSGYELTFVAELNGTDYSVTVTNEDKLDIGTTLTLEKVV